MSLFAAAFPDGPITKQPVSQLPWGHIIRLLQMVKDPAAREFYIREAIARGWSRSILEIQIQGQLHLRAGKALNNFAVTKPPAESDMAARVFKDPYLFGWEKTDHRNPARRVPRQPDLPPDTQGTMSMGEEMECARRSGIPTARRLTQTPYNSFHAPACRPLVSSGTRSGKQRRGALARRRLWGYAGASPAFDTNALQFFSCASL
jgi:hypothetical protein